MGTSTLRSYRGAQIYEAVGLGTNLINQYFTGTSSRIEGIGIEEIAKETLMKHKSAYNSNKSLLESEGVYSYRKDGERHAWTPETIHMLQWATRTNDYKKYKQFSKDELMAHLQEVQ